MTHEAASSVRGQPAAAATTTPTVAAAATSETSAAGRADRHTAGTSAHGTIATSTAAPSGRAHVSASANAGQWGGPPLVRSYPRYWTASATVKELAPTRRKQAPWNRRPGLATNTTAASEYARPAANQVTSHQFWPSGSGPSFATRRPSTTAQPAPTATTVAAPATHAHHTFVGAGRVDERSSD